MWLRGGQIDRSVYDKCRSIDYKEIMTRAGKPKFIIGTLSFSMDGMRWLQCRKWFYFSYYYYYLLVDGWIDGMDGLEGERKECKRVLVSKHILSDLSSPTRSITHMHMGIVLEKKKKWKRRLEEDCWIGPFVHRRYQHWVSAILAGGWWELATTSRR